MNIQDYKPTAEQLNNIRMNIITSRKFKGWRYALMKSLSEDYKKDLEVTKMKLSQNN